MVVLAAVIANLGLLAVFVGQTDGMLCYGCTFNGVDATSNPPTCREKTICSNVDKCLVKVTRDGATLNYEMGCGSPQTCGRLGIGKRALPEMTKHVGRRDAETVCQKCCEGNHCNHIGDQCPEIAVITSVVQALTSSANLETVAPPSICAPANLANTQDPNAHVAVAEAKDCLSLRVSGVSTSGVYKIFPAAVLPQGLDVYCDMDTDNGGWIVFQRRLNGSVDFYKPWATYKTGFGSNTGELWLGNDNLHAVTSGRNCELRVNLGDWGGNTAYAHYSTFAIGPSTDNYRLTATGYSGTAGDSLKWHNGRPFTTYDRNNNPGTVGTPKENCGIYMKGAWWYTSCAHSNLNGLYKQGEPGKHYNVRWWHWRGDWKTLKTTAMMVRCAQ